MSSAAGEMALAAVALPVPVRRLFTYRVAPGQREAISIGCRVRVPFARRRLLGTVVAWPAAEPEGEVELREIEQVEAGGPALGPDLLELTRFVAEYYLCSWGEAIEAALPPAVRSAATVRAARRRAGASVDGLPARATAQRRALGLLPADGAPLALDAVPPALRAALRSLVRAGAAEIVDAAREAGPQVGGEEPDPAPDPTPAQAAVLEPIRRALGGYAPYVLFGATGSGKTEVYLRAAREALDRGRGVLYLVPEIGLTPLLVSRIAGRFPGTLAVLHSRLPAAERRAAWERVRDGRARFVVGTRSAVFAPMHDLGLVVVDEEHDASYKQSEAPRYHGRDLAVLRARSAGAVILLGSATPSLESFQHARSGRYGLLRLGGRVHERPLPRVSIVDMREEFRRAGAVRPLSDALVRELAGCLERGEQALVLRNRRGWASALLCPTCGERVSCSECSLSMTWHAAAGRLRCHGCDLERRHPGACPRCGADDLRMLGEGTERVEHDLREALPGVRLARMDRDTTRAAGAQEALLRRFDRGDIDVLVGTQMIAKGHDFPRVTLVGVLSADHALGLPDFRAGERAFQLLTQVAGRAGRGERPGRVVVQAFDPGHPVLREAGAQDFEAFYAREIAYRRALRYPPLAGMVQVLVVDRDAGRAADWGRVVGEALRREVGERVLVSGPGPAPVERLRGRARQQILLRSAGRQRLVRAVERGLAAVAGEVPGRAILVDVDPLSLL